MTNIESKRNLVQLAIQNRRLKKTPIFTRQKKNTHPFLPVWFDVQLRNEQGNVEQLQAGNTYILVIKGNVNRSKLHTEGIIITEAIELHLRYALDTEVTIKLSSVDNFFPLTYQEAVSFKEEFSISIPNHVPTCNLIIGLSYIIPNSYPEELGERKIPVAGTYTPVDRKLLEVHQIETELPEDVAILAVSSHPNLSQKHAFKLRGWHLYGGDLIETSTSPTIVSVAKLMEHRDNPRAILGKIRLFSEDTPLPLKTWLSSLYKKYASRLSIIIIDTTALEIPWEMYELDDEQYLGAIVKVARWIPPRCMVGHRLHVGDICYEGSIITYLDTKLGERETTTERQILQELDSEPYTTLAALEDRIHLSLQRVGLIYIGCHGIAGSTLQEQYPDQLKATYLASIRKQPEPRPIGFINACESARIVRSNEWGDSSFVEILLQRCVSGYIGTLGKVGTVKASHIASNILKMAKRVEGAQIAEVLRRLREDAALQLGEMYGHPSSVREAYEYNLLYTFMYVYYGNPLTCLRLFTANPQSEEV